MKPKVYVTREIPSPGIEILQKYCEVEVHKGKLPPSREELLRKVSDKDGLLCLLTDRIDGEVMDAGKNLVVISTYSVGYDHIDIEEATKRGIYVAHTPGVLTEAVADFTWALILAITRRVVEADKFIRSGKWNMPWQPELLVGREVYGKTLGIVGFGRIGKAVAKRAKGFDMKILVYDIAVDEETAKSLGAEVVDLDTLLRESDIVSLHVPLTEGTRHMIGENELKKMKRTAFLINTARGPVVDEKALIRALREGWIEGAGIDVFEKEPTDIDNELLKLENVVVTPHIASASLEARRKMSELSATAIVKILKGEKPENLVNPEVEKIRPLTEVKRI